MAVCCSSRSVQTLRFLMGWRRLAHLQDVCWRVRLRNVTVVWGHVLYTTAKVFKSLDELPPASDRDNWIARIRCRKTSSVEHCVIFGTLSFLCLVFLFSTNASNDDHRKLLNVSCLWVILLHLFFLMNWTHKMRDPSALKVGQRTSKTWMHARIFR